MHHEREARLRGHDEPQMALKRRGGVVPGADEATDARPPERSDSARSSVPSWQLGKAPPVSPLTAGAAPLPIRTRKEASAALAEATARRRPLTYGPTTSPAATSTVYPSSLRLFQHLASCSSDASKGRTLRDIIKGYILIPGRLIDRRALKQASLVLRYSDVYPTVPLLQSLRAD